MRRLGGILGAVLAVALVALFLGPEQKARAATTSYIDLDQHDTRSDLAAGREYKTTVGGDGKVRLVRGATYGTLTSPVYSTSTRFDTLVPSWNATTPRGSWSVTQIKVRQGGTWSRWFNMGAWASNTSTVSRRSYGAQNWGKWKVLTDTVQAQGPVFAKAYQYRITLRRKSGSSASPALSKVSVVSSDSYRHGEDLGVPALKSAWGKSLPVPSRSQMVYPDGGEVWCSPTSLSMIMTYWAKKTGRSNLNQSPRMVARGTYDYGARIWGNWPFNTAYASAYGLETTVSRFSSIEQVERWVDMGIPVAASIAWDNRNANYRLSGAPLTWSDGHILVIRGFTRSGDVIVNDPAASSNSGVPRVYNRAEFSRAWLKTSGGRYGNFGNSGIVYLTHPPNWKTPYAYASKGSW